MASSKIEEYEGSMERGDDSILSSMQVAETREELATGSCFIFGLWVIFFPRADERPSLVTAIEYFEQAKNADPSTIGEDELAPLRPLVSLDFDVSVSRTH